MQFEHVCGEVLKQNGPPEYVVRGRKARKLPFLSGASGAPVLGPGRSDFTCQSQPPPLLGTPAMVARVRKKPAAKKNSYRSKAELPMGARPSVRVPGIARGT